ncbi:MAG: metal ABC transporter solute-binding protein, Zn/Mn family, partial [Candidatus Puniceispirillaceae bacterium]
MRSTLPFLLSFLLFFPQASQANLRVVTDITPIYGLVAQVMAGTGTPSVILRPGSDPHHYQLRPSEAATIEQADIIFWIGPELTPWLQPAFDTLAADAKIISLIKIEGLTRLAAGKDSHAHQHKHDNHKDEDEDKHDSHENEVGHDNSGTDPHLWLDPENARIWLQTIAQTLSLHDPENADIYRE